MAGGGLREYHSGLHSQRSDPRSVMTSALVRRLNLTGGGWGGVRNRGVQVAAVWDCKGTDLTSPTLQPLI